MLTLESNKNIANFFKPKSIAILGASANPNKIGYQILENILSGGYKGKVYPINPTAEIILTKKTYSNLFEISEDIDLAIISIPAPKVISALKDCIQKKISCVAIISSGFAEIGNFEDEKEIKRLADEHNISVLGPNMFGVVYTPEKLNASFGPKVSQDGHIAFITQSGALGISLMGWAEMENIGVASLVSIGNKCDITEKELIENFNNDPNVEVILIYMEGLKNAKTFMTTKITKPVVVLKVGRTSKGARAAASHTGSLAGSDKVYDAAFKQLGILRANTFTEAFGWSRTLSLPEPPGENIIIITNGGGIGVRTTDECENMNLSLFEDNDWLEKNFRQTMPEFGSTKNPIDITGQAGISEYEKALKVALEKETIHSIIILYCETTVTDPINISKIIKTIYDQSTRKKPIIAVMVGGEKTRNAIHYLNENQIPAFTSINEGVSGLKTLYLWKEIKKKLNKKKHIPKLTLPDQAIKLIDEAKQQGRSSLLEHEANELFRACNIPTARGGFASNMDDALRVAKGIYPVAMKICSPDILHKTDVDGVILNIRNDAELLLKYHHMTNRIKAQRPDAHILGVNIIEMIKGIECIIGLSEDEQFGPTVMFGLGGVFVEALQDVSFRVVPFSAETAKELLADIKGSKILNNFRGIQAHKDSIIEILMNIQKLSGYVKEVDINPLITNQNGSFAVDARVIL